MGLAGNSVVVFTLCILVVAQSSIAINYFNRYKDIGKCKDEKGNAMVTGGSRRLYAIAVLSVACLIMVGWIINIILKMKGVAI